MSAAAVRAERLINETARLMRYRPETPAVKVCSNGRAVEVKHRIVPAGEAMTVVSQRNALFLGLPYCKLTCPHDVLLRELVDTEHGSWMSDCPQEVAQMIEPLNRARGNILVGGLGLGVYPWLAARRRNVKSITVVERDPLIIAAVADGIRTRYGKARATEKIRIKEGDIYEYAKAVHPRDFDYAFLDTWQSTGEWAWVNEVVPLRRALARKIPVIDCWQEREMQGQFRLHVNLWLRTGQIPDPKKREGFVGARHEWVYLMAGQQQKTGPGGLRFLDLFLTQVGSHEWERVFGALWDEAAAWK